MTITGPLPPPTQVALAPPVEDGVERTQPADPGFQAFGADGFTFFDFLDVINPLQHIPLVSTLYRNLTGDTIDPGSRVAGGALFGGPIGAGLAVANVALEQTTGKDAGTHVFALFEGAPRNDAPLAAEGDGPAETAYRDVQSHIEVRQWAEREAAFHAAQADAQRHRPERQQMAAAFVPDAKEIAGVSGGSAVPPSTTAALLAAPAPGVSSSSTTSLGAAAPNGGWFTETMLSALTRYQESQQLSNLLAGETAPR